MRPPTLPVNLTIIILLTVWWLSNNIYAIDAEKFFNTFQSSYLYIDLTFTQLLLGLCLTHLHVTIFPHPGTSSPKSRTYLPILISTAHYLATLLTNISYSTLGSTTTLLWKLSEPGFTLFLNYLILRQAPSYLSLLGVTITLIGVIRFSLDTFSIPTFTPILLANLLFPLRNVLIKLDQPPEQHASKPSINEGVIPRFRGMLRRAIPLASAVLAIKILHSGFDIEAIPYMLRNASLFTVYQLASFLILEHLDALTHSLLNTLKRFTGILLSMFVMATPLSANHLQGLFGTVLGFVVYLVGRKRHKFGTAVIGGAVAAAFLVLGLITAFGSVLDIGVAKVTLDSQNQGFPNVGIDSGAVVRDDVNDQYLVTLVNEYRKRQRSITYNSYEEVLSDDGGNVGNLVWQYGAHVALPDFSQVDICESDQRDECSLVAKEKGLKHVVYNPQANTLNPEVANAFGGLAKRIREDRAETLIVGVGVQIEFRQNSDDPEFNSSARITVTSDDYHHPNSTKNFLREMENSGGYMLTRGAFSVNVTRRGGFTRGYSIGCPSFWINENVHLGRTLEQKYKAIAARQGDKSLKIAVNLKNVKGFHKQIAHIRDNYPNSRFYAQSIGDMNMLNNLKIPFERARFFTNVEDWVADLKEMDVGYGVRIHGNMIALGAGLPTFIVASDWRVLEMARAMKIPYTTTYDPVFEKDVDVAKMIDDMPKFDGEAFDRNRCKIAKIYLKVFPRYGIRVRKHVSQVSNLC